jgi:hypothetical protein
MTCGEPKHTCPKCIECGQRASMTWKGICDGCEKRIKREDTSVRSGGNDGCSEDEYAHVDAESDGDNG